MCKDGRRYCCQAAAALQLPLGLNGCWGPQAERDAPRVASAAIAASTVRMPADCHADGGLVEWLYTQVVKALASATMRHDTLLSLFLLSCVCLPACIADLHCMVAQVFEFVGATEKYGGPLCAWLCAHRDVRELPSFGFF